MAKYSVVTNIPYLHITLKIFLHFVFHYAWNLHEGILYKFIPCVELVYPNPSRMLSELLMFKKSLCV